MLRDQKAIASSKQPTATSATDKETRGRGAGAEKKRETRAATERAMW